MGVEIISVHFPKAGGTSLRESFRAAYGENAVCIDYGDDPANPCSRYRLDPVGCLLEARASIFPPEVKVLHGHFHPSKYQHFEDVKRITFLRHPIDTLISICYFWKSRTEGHCLAHYFRDKGLSLLELARIPDLRYILSRAYFGGVDMKTFDFVGTMENYAEDRRRLSALLAIPLADSRVNTNTYPGYREEVEAIKSNKELIGNLQDLLIDDIKFYERALTLR